MALINSLEPPHKVMESNDEQQHLPTQAPEGQKGNALIPFRQKQLLVIWHALQMGLLGQSAKYSTLLSMVVVPLS